MTTPTPRLQARQQLGPVAQTTSTPCPPLTLSIGGTLTLGPSSTIVLATPFVYSNNNTCTVPDPFYASTWVFIYVLATCTTIAWLLLVMLLIPRTSHSGSESRTSRWRPSNNLATAITGRAWLGGLGDKPWLQKVAVFLVAVGLTVASCDTIKLAGMNDGHEIVNASDMRDEVSGSMEVRIVRIISTVFVYLAQIQTLIRLFPRRKEKLIIKWFGFGLILCDLIFSSLNSFLPRITYRSSPTSYEDAIPAFTYLFQLAIGLLYLAWVTYYVITKKRYAFFIPGQLNILIIATLALVSISLPVAFFVADIAVPKVAGWGDFFRWVGTVAASITVWEWVDRIEDVEKEEKKDGILGREVFDEDELPTSEDRSLADGRSGHGDSGMGGWIHMFGKRAADASFMLSGVLTGAVRKGRGRISSKNGSAKLGTSSEEKEMRSSDVTTNSSDANSSDTARLNRGSINRRSTLGVPARTQTTSADSTDFAVHYYPVTDTPPLPEVSRNAEAATSVLAPAQVAQDGTSTETAAAEALSSQTASSKTVGARLTSNVPGWIVASNAFKRRKKSPPIEVKQALSLNAVSTEVVRPKPTVLSRFGAAFKHDTIEAADTDSPQAPARITEPMVIPAPPRGHTWSPGFSRHSPVDALKPGAQTSLQVNPALYSRADQAAIRGSRRADVPSNHGASVIAQDDETEQGQGDTDYETTGQRPFAPRAESDTEVERMSDPMASDGRHNSG